MAKYIDKSVVVAEIEKLISNGKLKCQQSQENNDQVSYIAWSEHIATCGKILSFLNTLKAKEVDLKKEIDNYMNNHHLYIQDGGRIVFRSNGDIPNFWCDFRDIAKFFFELGLKTKGE